MPFIVLAFLLLTANAVQGRFDDKCALKQHVRFFDRDQDGIIHISETTEGSFKALGIRPVWASAFTMAIHAKLSSKTCPRMLGGGKSRNGLPIVISNIKLAKHTSDTGVYDHEGRFVPEKFEEIFAKYARKRPDALNSSEIDKMVKDNRQSGNDYRNWLAASSEWKLLYRLGKDADDFLPRCHVKNVYDGSFFHQLAEKISTKRYNTSA